MLNQTPATPQLLSKRELAAALGISERSVVNLKRQRKIPFLRISSRLVRYSLPSVTAALNRFEVKEAGRST